MPSNQQRREAAKRKLERQLVRREERARGRRQVAIIVGVVAAVLVAGAVVWIVRSPHGSSTAATTPTDTASATDSTTTSSAKPSTPCSYPASTDKAAKPVKAPSNLSPANTGTADVTVMMNGRAVPITLNRVIAPCAVNSFLSLAAQKFYDSTSCWRLTASEGLNILQCGDPTGKGTGGPGYTFANEIKTTEKFPVGTVAMANSGSDNTNGSQFFVVYKASVLPATYTVLGTVSGAGLSVLDSLTAPGVAKGAQDGPPAQKITIDSITIPANATSGTGSYPKTTSAAPAATQ